MANKTIMMGFVAIAFVAGSMMTSSIVYAEPNGTPFLQEEIDAIILIIQDLQDQLDNLHVTWENVTEKPPGFADDIDNDTLALLDCTTNQIVKHNGEQWICSDTASKSDKAEIALRKVDCNLIRSIYIEPDEEPYQFDVVNGCDLTEISKFDRIDFSGAHLAEADFEDSTFYRVHFIGADFTGAVFTNVGFEEVDFIGADLSGVVFTNVEFDDVDFTGAFANPPCTGNDICNDIPPA